MEVIVQRCDEWGIFAWAGPPSTHGRTNAIARGPQCYPDIDLSRFPAEGAARPHGDASFTLSRRGLQLRLMVAVGDLRNVGGVGSEHVFTVKPNHVKGNTFTSVRIQATLDEPERYEWAVGIVNYLAVEELEVGKLEGRKDYLCFLLSRTSGGSWRKVATENILLVHTLFCWESREPLSRLWL
ncbi:uncharacterized protein FIBRA_06893 [Fibroporia radiculosa]|uniref:Uncharacterized protein n=1 Tax=Fibroporia radiculosa TaxID=599839 RepID=J4HZT9_9APHY|nr:uncharacterized protein FIBRA_06893 [Fibroporia radiculosa]CCM04707.1 predicted protein [Fibroporia radiculosa]